MRFVYQDLNGAFKEGNTAGENMSLGASFSKHSCLCGATAFVDGGPHAPPTERDPDRICACGRKFWYYEDESEHLGYLH